MPSKGISPARKSLCLNPKTVGEEKNEKRQFAGKSEKAATQGIVIELPPPISVGHLCLV